MTIDVWMQHPTVRLLNHDMLIVRSCTGELDWAHRELTSLRRRCIENGQDGELMLVALHGGLIEIWRGQFAAAALIAEDTMQLALQLGGDLPLSWH